MAAKTVIIGCKLPHGLMLNHPKTPDVTVELKGLNSSKLAIPYATTEVDGEFWAAWKKDNSQFPALLSCAIFEAPTEADAAAMAKELVDEKTGLEPLAQDGDDRASGIVTATVD